MGQMGQMGNIGLYIVTDIKVVLSSNVVRQCGKTVKPLIWGLNASI